MLLMANTSSSQKMNTKPAKSNLGKAPITSDISTKCLANSCLDTYSEKELTITCSSPHNKTAYHNPWMA